MGSSIVRGDGFGTFDPATGLTVEERREVLDALKEAHLGEVDDRTVERVKELLGQMNSWMEQAAAAQAPVDGAPAPAPAEIPMEVLRGLE